MDPNPLQPFYAQTKAVCLDFFAHDDGNQLADLLERLLRIPNLPIHCPVHHYIVPAALLTVCRRAQKQDEALLRQNLDEALKRALHVPGGFCGFYGTCGAAVGLGVFWSVITDSGPLTRQTWGELNRATGQALLDMAELGGPRCCKRSTYTALKSVTPQIARVLKLELRLPEQIHCGYHAQNQDCLRQACPYYPRQATA